MSPGCAHQVKDQQAQREAELVRQAKESALKALVTMSGEPQHLWAEAVKLVRKYTRAAAAYVAVIADEEEPDWVPPEDAENPDAETEDEGDAPPAAAEGEGAAGEEAAPAEGEEGGEGAAAEGEAAKGPKPKDYSKKLLSYVCANQGQEFVEGVVLRRPAAGGEAEGGEEGAPAAKAPLTFSILDELRPLVEVRTTGCSVCNQPCSPCSCRCAQPGTLAYAAVARVVVYTASLLDASWCTLYPQANMRHALLCEQNAPWSHCACPPH